MDISKIFIACYKGDVHLTRICVASIRYWYPGIKIFLIKDYLRGNFNTKDIEKYYNVEILKTKITKFGWGMSKLEPFFIKEREKVLIIDSDIIFVGKVLDKLNEINTDFIVSGDKIDDINSDWVKRTYLNFERLKKYDSSFKKPDYLFNTGQFVITTGMIKRKCFENFVDFNSTPISLLKNDFLTHTDQGLLNYLLLKKSYDNEISISSIKFHIWPCLGWADFIDFEKIKNKTGYPFLIHWAGCTKRDLSKMKRYDLISFFEKLYYHKIPFGKIIYLKNIYFRKIYTILFNIKQKCKINLL